MVQLLHNKFLFVYLHSSYKNNKFFQSRGCGEIGRHARLRIWCRKVCRFESYHPHF